MDKDVEKEEKNPEKPLLFEVAWEVARKVGGIYTVLTSKAPVTVNEWGERYAMVGLWDPNAALQEFEEIKPSSLSRKILKNMEEKHNIKVHFGRWLVKGYPRVFLLDLNSSMHKLSEWRWDLMGDIQKPDDVETNEAIVFGYQVAYLLEETCNVVNGRPIVAHFHEWLSSVGLIICKRRQLRVATIFTTHATLLGRWLAAGRVDLYSALPYVNPDVESGNRNIYQRHWIETGAAKGADVFTTVSDITGYEAQYILGKKPDLITPNGLNLNRMSALHEFQNLHALNKQKINDFVRGHFAGNHHFDLDKTLYFFTAGRREYRNKGVDLFIEALAQLNYLLKQHGPSDVTVVGFIIMPGNTNNYNVETIRGQFVRREIQETCDRVSENVAEIIFENIMTGKLPDVKGLLTQEDLVNIKRRVLSIYQSHGVPPIVTHNVIDSDSDEVLCHLRSCQLLNNREDRVKVVYHPQFLNSTSPVLSMDYEDFIRGCHMGVFPSYYEPWGYTPAECTVMGVPSMTSNLTGFASFMSRRISNPEQNGIYVVDRRYKSFVQCKEQMANVMWRFCQLNRIQRIQLRNRVERLSSMLDWRCLGKNYVRARNQALKKVFGVELPVPGFYYDQNFI